jgi:hypothetical protein
MTNQLPYADYVRIEVRANGHTRVIEFAPLEWDPSDRPQVTIKPEDIATDVHLFGKPGPVRLTPRPWPTMRFEVSGPQMKITVDDPDQEAEKGTAGR